MANILKLSYCSKFNLSYKLTEGQVKNLETFQYHKNMQILNTKSELNSVYLAYLILLILTTE